MTIIAGFSSSRQGPAPINLAAQVARTTGEKVIAAAVIERPWPPKTDPVENEYLRYVGAQAAQSIERAVSELPGGLDISTVIHQSTSIPTGLIELAAIHEADLVVVGSSSSGLLGRVGLGSVTERLVHTASVPVAIAPRGYPSGSVPIRRLTAAYGGEADVNGLVAAVAELAKSWSVPLRIVSFTVRPVRMFAGSIEPSAEELVVAQWSRRTIDDIDRQLKAFANESRFPTSMSWSAAATTGGRQWRRCPGTPATCWCWDRAQPARRPGLPWVGGIEDPASRSRARDDRAQVPIGGIIFGV